MAAQHKPGKPTSSFTWYQWLGGGIALLLGAYGLFCCYRRSYKCPRPVLQSIAISFPPRKSPVTSEAFQRLARQIGSTTRRLGPHTIEIHHTERRLKDLLLFLVHLHHQRCPPQPSFHAPRRQL